MRNDAHLVFGVTELPSPPWPATIGGVPFIVADNSGNNEGDGAFLFPMNSTLGPSEVDVGERSYRRRAEIFTDMDFTQKGSVSHKRLSLVTSDLMAYLEQHIPGVRVEQVMFDFYCFFHVFFSDDVDIAPLCQDLPRRIARCWVFYHNTRHLCRPDATRELARREVALPPASGVIDDTPYDILRPGVAIACDIGTQDHPLIAQTTSGVLVKDGNGRLTMTAASHRMASDGVVFLPKTNRTIGTVSAHIANTDVSLVGLADDVQFDNAPFETFDDVPHSFSRLITEDDDVTHDTCFLDSAYSGLLDGVVAAKSIQIEGIEHIGYNWHYFGREKTICPPDGVCGAPIWNQDGVVLGFYHFYVEQGRFARLSASVSALNLSRAGLELCV